MERAEQASPGAGPLSLEQLRALLEEVARVVADALGDPERVGDAAAKLVAYAQLVEAAVRQGLSVDELMSDYVFIGYSMLKASILVDSDGKPYIVFEVYCDADIPTLYRLVERETLKPEHLESYAKYLREVAEFMEEAARLLRDVDGVEASTKVHRNMFCSSEGHSVELEYWFEVPASPPPSVDEARELLLEVSKDVDRVEEVCGMAP